jgi:hypothetical protein
VKLLRHFDIDRHEIDDTDGNQLHQNHGYAKFLMCICCQRSEDDMGHVISSDGFSMNEKRVQAISTWPTPSCKRDVPSFLVMIKFCRRFIKGRSALAQPLTCLTENELFVVNPAAQRAAYIPNAI